MTFPSAISLPIDIAPEVRRKSSRPATKAAWQFNNCFNRDLSVKLLNLRIKLCPSPRGPASCYGTEVWNMKIKLMRHIWNESFQTFNISFDKVWMSSPGFSFFFFNKCVPRRYKFTVVEFLSDWSVAETVPADNLRRWKSPARMLSWHWLGWHGIHLGLKSG